MKCIIIFLFIGLIFENAARMSMQDKIDNKIGQIQRENYIQALITEMDIKYAPTTPR